MVFFLISCGGGNTQSTTIETDPTLHYSYDTAQIGSFLTKSTFGPIRDDIDNFKAKFTYKKWIDHQFNLKPTYLYPRAIIKINDFKNKNPNTFVSPDYFYDAFYYNAMFAPDQLRQRVAFALSEIFVISFTDDNILGEVAGATNYYDQLMKHSFGNFRDLLEEVTYSPMMGHYLTYIKNQKADASGRVPDENFAREVMQLFTIGLYELNMDGSVKVKNSQPIETYTNQDITGLAKVFTGLSFSGPDTEDKRFYGWGASPDVNRYISRMQIYPQFHSMEEKKFLGKTIPSGTPGAESIKIALDTLFNHPNVGPFISKQLIQRLVKSNPSSQYVQRVAQVFNNNGAGVRGDMKSVVAAILLDSEAIEQINSISNDSGKIKEPILKQTQILRFFKGQSNNGDYSLGNTSHPLNDFSQTPLRSPSVFNFFKPGYTPKGTSLDDAGLVAPELQIIDESSIVGLNNSTETILWGGIGRGWPRQIQLNFDEAFALSTDAVKLFDYFNTYLAQGKITDKDLMIQEINSIRIPVLRTKPDGTTNQINIDDAKGNRVKLMFYMTLNHPEYILEK